SESAQQYAKLTQTEAIGRVEGLESAMRRLTEMEQQRAQAWREAAHDLRGNLGVVKNATEVLHRVGDADGTRDRMMTLLKSGVDSLHDLLNALMDLARLEAGQEQLSVAPFDAAALLRDLCANTHALALERGLFLHSDGPASLPVSGDAVKLRRIAQNLILNALQYTEQGGVTVSWSLRNVPDAERWVLCVQDTGPGFSDGAVPPIAQALKKATDEAQSVEHTSEQANAPEQRIKRASTLSAQSGHRHQRAGEGIGLAIVKRVCELLDASLELETAPGQGSTFRVSLPLRYDGAGADPSAND
ncbi:MAG: HAMP domain-containing sensor histidine kinase, partial [Betaproteobacteria bacterium]